MKKYIFFVLGILVLSSFSFSQDEDRPAASASVQDKVYTIGDNIRYTVTIVADPSLEIEFPAIDKKIGDFELKDAGRIDKDIKGKRRLEVWYVLRTFETGAKTIPPLRIAYKKPGETALRSVETNPVQVNIESVFEKSPDKSDIRDIKGVFFISRTLPVLKIALIIFVLLCILGIAFYLKKKLGSRKTPEVIKLPHEIAYERLRVLKGKGLIEKGHVKEFYFELSDILRRYIEDRFHLKAPEMTTEEFLIYLKGSRDLSVDHKYLLRDFLSHCDLVKFAKYGPTKIEIGKSWESAESFVDQTKEEEKKNGI